MATGGTSYVLDTPVLRPSKEDFSRPFCEYIAKVLKKNPDIPMFKVVPPEGWKPRRAPIRLTKLDIQCPIKQHAYGTKGSYRCILVEQKSLSAEQFREIAQDEEHAPPKKVREGEDRLLERSFWSSVTINPPLYGADTPMSLFDEKLPYGWNLRNLGGCLLKHPDVPQVPGVTTPMVYFGMWKAFFAWHVEDADLFSINYLHFGAPKVWYCVSPSNRAKFERMCQSIFPELHKGCKAFMRHKDILLSPSLLRTYGIEYMQARQEPNEFIVLNAAAYHAGYNMGFNCAEAVNFAPKAWIEVGRHVVRCKCRDDGVRLSMRLFGCSSGSSASDSDSEDCSSSGDGSSGEEGSEEEEVSSRERSGSGSEEEEEEEEQQQQQGKRGRRAAAVAARARGTPGAAAPRRRGGKDGADSPASPAAGSKRGAPAAAAAAAAAEGPRPKRSRVSDSAALGPSPQRGPRKTRTSLAAAAAAKSMRRTHATAEARARLAVQRGRAAKRRDSDGDGADDGSAGGGSRHHGKKHGHGPKRSRANAKRVGDLEDSLQRAAAAAAAIRARHLAARQQQQQQQQQQHSEQPSTGTAEQQELAEQQLQQQEQQEQPLPEAVGELQQQYHHHHHHHQAAAAAAGAAVKEEQGEAAAADADDPDSPTATKACLRVAGKVKLEGEEEQEEDSGDGGAAAAAEDGGGDAAAAAAAPVPVQGLAGLLGFGRGGLAGGRGAAPAAASPEPPAGEAPRVILGEDSRGERYFFMVQVLRDHKAKRRGHLVMRWLKEGKDGLFRPSQDTWEEPASTLVGVRTQWVPASGGRPGGYRLLTLRSRILATQLQD